VAGQWFSPGTLISSTYKTDRHDIIEILLNVVLNSCLLCATSVAFPVLEALSNWNEEPLEKKRKKKLV
jgi:hypothetical protein